MLSAATDKTGEFISGNEPSAVYNCPAAKPARKQHWTMNLWATIEDRKKPSAQVGLTGVSSEACLLYWPSMK